MLNSEPLEFDSLIRIVPVTTLRQALALRKIRNECRQFMTHDTSHIGIVRQIKWFYQVYQPARRNGDMFAYILQINGKRKTDVAFGMLNYRHLVELASYNWTVTGGVRKHLRGNGWGKIMFRFLSFLKDGEDIYLDVLGDNTPAVSLYHRIGYKETLAYNDRDGNDILVMRLDK